MDDCHGPARALEAGGRAGGRGEALQCGSVYSSAVSATCAGSAVNLPPTVYLCGSLPLGRDDEIIPCGISMQTFGFICFDTYFKLSLIMAETKTLSDLKGTLKVRSVSRNTCRPKSVDVFILFKVIKKKMARL